MMNTSLLTEIANLVNGKIAKVVINNIYEIINFQVKQVDNSTATLNYIVPYSEIQTITQIDVKEADDTIISSNTVDIPLTADQLIVQTIEAKEV